MRIMGRFPLKRGPNRRGMMIDFAGRMPRSQLATEQRAMGTETRHAELIEETDRTQAKTRGRGQLSGAACSQAVPLHSPPSLTPAVWGASGSKNGGETKALMELAGSGQRRRGDGAVTGPRCRGLERGFSGGVTPCDDSDSPVWRSQP